MTELDYLFFQAIRQGQWSRVKEYLQRGIAVDRGDRQGRTPLMYGVVAGNPNAVEMLLLAGAQVDFSPHTHQTTPLMLASAYGQEAILAMLLQAGASVNRGNIDQSTALMIAAYHGHLGIATQLLAAGAEVNWQDKDGDSAMAIALTQGHASIVDLLLQAGADLNLLPDRGAGFLTRTVQLGQTGLFQRLVSYGVVLNLEAWLTAASENQPQILQQFIDRGWDINATDDQGETALHLACLEGHGTIVEMLLAAGAKLDRLSASGDSPLLQALRQSDLGVVAQLLGQGADPNLGEGDERPLLAACRCGDAELVDRLLQAGANPNLVYENGQSALAKVADQGNLVLIDLLLQAGAAVNQADPRGITPLMWASYRGHPAVVARLLQVPEIDLHCRHQGGLTALALAQNNHFSAIVACLRQAGAVA